MVFGASPFAHLDPGRHPNITTIKPKIIQCYQILTETRLLYKMSVANSFPVEIWQYIFDILLEDIFIKTFSRRQPSYRTEYVPVMALSRQLYTLTLVCRGWRDYLASSQVGLEMWEYVSRNVAVTQDALRNTFCISLGQICACHNPRGSIDCKCLIRDRLPSPALSMYFDSQAIQRARDHGPFWRVLHLTYFHCIFDNLLKSHAGVSKALALHLPYFLEIPRPSSFKYLSFFSNILSLSLLGKICLDSIAIISISLPRLRSLYFKCVQHNSPSQRANKFIYFPLLLSLTIQDAFSLHGLAFYSWKLPSLKFLRISNYWQAHLIELPEILPSVGGTLLSLYFDTFKTAFSIHGDFWELFPKLREIAGNPLNMLFSEPVPREHPLSILGYDHMVFMTVSEWVLGVENLQFLRVLDSWDKLLSPASLQPETEFNIICLVNYIQLLEEWMQAGLTMIDDDDVHLTVERLNLFSIPFYEFLSQSKYRHIIWKG